MFENPIKNGRYADSTRKDVILSKKRSYILHRLLQPIVMRRDASILRQVLPPKSEFVISVKMSPLQVI
jgi:transcriptional regulator ATRX